MKISILALMLFFSLNIYGQSPSLSWAKHIVGNDYNYAESMERDVNGNLYVVGRFSGTADFDLGTSLQNHTSNSNVNASTFILKLDANANFIWVKIIDSSLANFKITPAGNLLLYGRFLGTTDFDPNAGVQNLSSANGGYFLCELDTAGNFQWVKQFGNATSGTNIYGAHGTKITFDNVGNIILMGGVSSTADVDPGPGVFTLGSNGGATFVLKLNPTANLIWAKEIVGASAESLAVDAAGGVCMVGLHNVGATDFDPGPGVYNLSSTYFGTMFLMKLDANGIFAWAHSFDIKAVDIYHRNISIDNNNEILVTSVFNDTVDLDPSSGIHNLISIGTNDLFIAKYNPSGGLVWAKHLEGIVSNASNNEIMTTTVDANNNFYISGGLGGSTFDFDPSVSTKILAPTSTYVWPIFIAKYNTNGDLEWAESLFGKHWGLTTDIEVTANNELIICGAYLDSLQADLSFGNYYLGNPNNHTGFIAKYNFGSLGVKELANKIDFTLYPNPAFDYVQIQCTEPILDCHTFDISGKEMNLSRKDNQLSIQSLAAGVYLVQIETSKGIGIRKFMKE